MNQKYSYKGLLFLLILAFIPVTSVYAKDVWNWNELESEYDQYTANASGVYTAKGLQSDNDLYTEITLKLYPKGRSDKKLEGVVSCPADVEDYDLVGAIKNLIYIAYEYGNDTSQLIAYKLSSKGVTTFAEGAKYDTNLIELSHIVFNKQILTVFFSEADDSRIFNCLLLSKKLKQKKKLEIELAGEEDTVIPSYLDFKMPKFSYLNRTENLEGKDFRFIECYK